jgi:hypothetical protein
MEFLKALFFTMLGVFITLAIVNMAAAGQPSTSKANRKDPMGGEGKPLLPKPKPPTTNPPKRPRNQNSLFPWLGKKEVTPEPEPDEEMGYVPTTRRFTPRAWPENQL